MSFNVKTIVVSAVSLLAMAGALYSFMPQKTAPMSGAPAASTQIIANVNPENQKQVANGPNVAGADAKRAESAVAIQPSALEQPTIRAPKKLTRQQLTPPPQTEAEKLEKAAEQESNF